MQVAAVELLSLLQKTKKCQKKRGQGGEMRVGKKAKIVEKNEEFD